MKRTFFFLSFALLLFSAIIGCGKNNILQGFSKPDENEDKLQMAQDYLDDGEYDKALSLANDLLRDGNTENDSDARVVKGEALLGRAGANLNSILAKIDLVNNDSATCNFSALYFIAESRFGDLYSAADTLLAANSDDRSAQLATGIACMLATVAKVNTTFDASPPMGDGIGEPKSNPGFPNTDVSPDWKTISTNVTTWTVQGLAALAYATGQEDLRNAAASLNEEITSVNSFIEAVSGPLPYSTLLTILGF